MNTMKNPPSGNQGLAFQTHALQMTLFGPFSRANPTLLGSLRIASLQNLIIKYFKYLIYYN